MSPDLSAPDLTVPETATALRCSTRKVFQLLQAGVLTRGPQFGRETIVSRASVVAALAAASAENAPRPRRRRPRGDFDAEIDAWAAKARATDVHPAGE